MQQDYNKILQNFDEILATNTKRAKLKKSEYLDKIMLIFKQFISKCEKEIDHIIDEKIMMLRSNWEKVRMYVGDGQQRRGKEGKDEGKEGKDEGDWDQERNLVIVEFLVKPFEKFPFTGHKNEKLFKQQYNLIEKASILIQQTLTQSFKQDQIPSFKSTKFFKSIHQKGLSKQSLTKLRLNPQNFSIRPLQELTPHQNKITSILKLTNQLMVCFGKENWLELWDFLAGVCVRKVYVDVGGCGGIGGGISTGVVVEDGGCHYLGLGFNDDNPVILMYRLDSWTQQSHNIAHTRKITKLLHYQQYLISGSADGLLCIHNLKTLKVLVSSPHMSGIEDIFGKDCLLYVLQKNSAVLEYQVGGGEGGGGGLGVGLNFRRSISAGYVSMIRFPELTTNFSGIGCHIYGLSQIQITPKFKLEQSNIINVPQMISDFLLLQSKQTSEYFAVCVFQNIPTIRIYSLTTQQQVYQYNAEYTGEVGASGYLPKIQIFWAEENGKYVFGVVGEAEFQDQGNFVKIYQLGLG